MSRNVRKLKLYPSIIKSIKVFCLKLKITNEPIGFPKQALHK